MYGLFCMEFASEFMKNVFKEVCFYLKEHGSELEFYSRKWHAPLSGPLPGARPGPAKKADGAYAKSYCIG